MCHIIKCFEVLSALRDSNIPVAEFDTHWGEKGKALRTDEDKRTFIKMLKEVGVGGGKGGGHKIKLRRKVWLVKTVVGRDTNTPTSDTTPIERLDKNVGTTTRRVSKRRRSERLHKSTPSPLKKVKREPGRNRGKKKGERDRDVRSR